MREAHALSINISELIWTVICFFVLLVVLKKLLFDPLVSFMAARDARIQDGISAGRKPKSLCQLIEGIHEQKIREIQQKQFFHVHLCTLRSLTFTFSRSMVRCSAFSAVCSFAWV
ncbi:MAG: hypothetical protein EGQ45_03960, partial [Clostridiales bacterium]|nr:hypothetical protein [Clostridiales bacterium]